MTRLAFKIFQSLSLEYRATPLLRTLSSRFMSFSGGKTWHRDVILLAALTIALTSFTRLRPLFCQTADPIDYFTRQALYVG